MYAIVKTGGKQYRVERGQTLLVERLPADEGASVGLQPLMYRSDETVVDEAGLAQVKLRGLARVDCAFVLGLAAYNLVRLPKLLAGASP